MKSIVLLDEMKGKDIKPTELFNRYLGLTEEDVKERLARGPLKATPCPACRAPEAAVAFEKFTMRYRECPRCQTLYASPRPAEPMLRQFYQQSPSRAFWRDELSRFTRKQREEKILKPRFEWILDSTQEYLPSASHLVDVQTGQYSYVDMLHEDVRFSQKTLIDPLLTLEASPRSGFDVICRSFDEVTLSSPADVISLFEVIDHVSDIDAVMNHVDALLRPGGLCFLTTVLSSGFDIQVLWERAENIFPPDRLNVLSVDGWQALFQRGGWECLEFSTPGVLDVEIVARALQGSPNGISRFAKTILTQNDEKARSAFQEFLQANLLSSYARILIRKKGNK